MKDYATVPPFLAAIFAVMLDATKVSCSENGHLITLAVLGAMTLVTVAHYAHGVFAMKYGVKR